ncbi:hypothetical protein M2373_000447 [Chryseobacterium sp. JUb7]|nr:hypothetical protein [Chryseobacterium sp. JUb7]
MLKINIQLIIIIFDLYLNTNSTKFFANPVMLFVINIFKTYTWQPTKV